MTNLAHVFSHLSLSSPSLAVDSGQLSVAVLPLASLANAGSLRACVVLPLRPGDGLNVHVTTVNDLRCIRVSGGTDLRVPEDGEEWVLVLGDPCYYLDGEYGTDTDYGRACRATDCERSADEEERDPWGFFDLAGGGRAFVSATVYGDGRYPVSVRTASFDLTLEYGLDDEWGGDEWDDEDEEEEDEEDEYDLDADGFPIND